MSRISQEHKAHIAPFLLFILLIGAGQLLESVSNGHPLFRTSTTQYWIYPLQTIACAALLFRYRRCYPLGRLACPGFTLLAALLAFLLWIAPQTVFHQPSRLAGFDPTIFQNSPPLFWSVIALRFLRAVVVVALLEEIFWRSFLMRDLISNEFMKVPFGSFSRLSFGAVAVGFCLEHQQADWPAALATGVLYNLVACKTKSLTSCVVAHGVTNLLLSFYVMQTKQWGFW